MKMTTPPFKVDKPWGYYIVHRETGDKSVCIKTLVINPGHQISLQYHLKRSEFWYISDPESYYELNLSGDEYEQWGIAVINIKKLMEHSIKNLGDKPLVIHETQYGYCDDKDIVRLYDPYKDKR